MGQRGPSGKPTNKKILQGTFRKDRAPDNEAKPDIVEPEKPSWLTLYNYKQDKDEEINIKVNGEEIDHKKYEVNK